MVNPYALESLPERCAALGEVVGLRGSRGFVVPWDTVQSSLQTELPSSYKAFIEYFGPGAFSEEFEYLTPGIANIWYELEFQVREEFNAAKRREEGRSGLSAGGLQFFPAPAGLLQLGSLPADLVYWDTAEKDPDDWPIVVPDPAYGDYLIQYNGDIVSFINALLAQDPSVDGLEYDPELIRVFAPDDGQHRGDPSFALKPVSYFAGTS